jgi:predicted RNase H-like HicB family nuclease
MTLVAWVGPPRSAESRRLDLNRRCALDLPGMSKRRTTKGERTATSRSTPSEYTVVFAPAGEGGYVVTVPALPGLHTEGDTFEEAQAMAADAIPCYIEGCLLDGEEVPEAVERP